MPLGPSVLTRPRTYTTPHNLVVTSLPTKLQRNAQQTIDKLVRQLDSHRGACFQSSYEFPNRYARWTMAFVDPPLLIQASNKKFEIKALNQRGKILLVPIRKLLDQNPAIQNVQQQQQDQITANVRQQSDPFPEEDRSRQNSIFSLVRAPPPRSTSATVVSRIQHAP